MRVLVFDSGLGGLTVFRPVAEMLPQAELIYVADNAAFPYGRWPERKLLKRLSGLFADLVATLRPDMAVIACNTASTIALEPLRQSLPIPLVGTVPAVKVAAEASRSRMFSVLATPGTVQRVYTHELIERFAPDCRVRLVGARGLAGIAEAALRGVEISPDHVRSIIEPAFEEEEGKRTDAIVLACTHYPLLLPQLKEAAPWPVNFIDPAEAIARQAERVAARIAIGAPPQQAPEFYFTADTDPERRMAAVLKPWGFGAPKLFPGWDKAQFDKAGIRG
ncbi:MAG: glutamate racemase [Hyphomicrobiales bacterium]|nr:MAG: glutamate racemase [Hyphomicrobiales bacterium]